MFYSSKLNKFENLKHCFFSRKSGFSKGIYKSLNCGKGSKDSKKNINKNLNFVSKKMKCKKNDILTLRQIHSNKVIYFNNQNYKKKYIGDAIITKKKNIAISVLTADCVPILFYEPNKKIIGCVHAGWKGAFKGIIKNTIAKFKSFGCSAQDIIVAIGPCIKKKNYEVGKEFYKKFIKKNGKYKVFFSCYKKNKYLFDIRGFVYNQLKVLKVKKIDNILFDTYSQKQLFYSYRRSISNKETDYGRCISVILMT